MVDGASVSVVSLHNLPELPEGVSFDAHLLIKIRRFFRRKNGPCQQKRKKGQSQEQAPSLTAHDSSLYRKR
jgi:hypothetical protein